jgi:hypothetical protein
MTIVRTAARAFTEPNAASAIMARGATDRPWLTDVGMDPLVASKHSAWHWQSGAAIRGPAPAVGRNARRAKSKAQVRGAPARYGRRHPRYDRPIVAGSSLQMLQEGPSLMALELPETMLRLCELTRTVERVRLRHRFSQSRGSEVRWPSHILSRLVARLRMPSSAILRFFERKL